MATGHNVFFKLAQDNFYNTNIGMHLRN